MSTPAAAHMAIAFEALLSKNDSPHCRRWPAGGWIMQTGEEHPFANFAIGFPDEQAAEVAAHLAADGGPCLICSDAADPAPIREAVGVYGFAHSTTPAMSVALADLVLPELPDGYMCERVRSSDDGGAWAEALSEGYGVPILTSRAMSPVHTLVSDEPDAMVQFYQVRQGDKIAAVSALVLAEGVAGIYCVATRADQRGKGLGAAVTAIPLLAARDLGYAIGVLQSSEAGYSVYRRLGFVDDGIVHFFVRPPD